MNSKTGKDRQRQAKTGKDRQRQAKTGKDRQRQAKTGKDRQRQAKTGTTDQFGWFGRINERRSDRRSLRLVHDELILPLDGGVVLMTDSKIG